MRRLFNSSSPNINNNVSNSTTPNLLSFSPDLSPNLDSYHAALDQTPPMSFTPLLNSTLDNNSNNPNTTSGSGSSSNYTKNWLGQNSNRNGGLTEEPSSYSSEIRPNISRNNTSNSQMNGNNKSTSSSNRKVEEEEEDDEEVEASKLPFSSARRISSAPPLTLPIGANSINSGYQIRNNSNNNRTGGVTSPELVMGRIGEEKDSIMVDLLSSQALMESRDYLIMDWDGMQEVKKEHNILASRVAALSRSLALETKLRDTASKLVKASLPRSTSSPAFTSSSSSTTSSRPRVTREQAESQLSIANSKISSLSADLYQIGWKEAQLRTQLLQHTAGILALATTRHEELFQGLPQSPLPNTVSLPSLTSSLTTTRRISSAQSTNSRSAIDLLKFEGHHFYSGNKEAVIPAARSPLFISPQLTPIGGLFPSDLGLVRELEALVDKLRQDLIQSTRDKNSAIAGLESQLEDLRDQASRSKKTEESNRGDVDGSRRELENLKRNFEISSRDLGSSKLEVERVRAEADQHRREADVSRREGDSSRQEAENHRKELSDTKRQLLVLQNDLEDSKIGRTRENEGKSATSAALQAELIVAKRDAIEFSKKLSLTKLEWEEASHRCELAEKQTMELEGELSEFRTKSQRDIARLQSDLTQIETRSVGMIDSEAASRLKEDLRNLKEERVQVSQSIGDVLRRHRTRSAMGGVLRDLPAFDDTAVLDRPNLAQYLSTTIDSHFEKVAAHVTDLNTDLTTVQTQQEDMRTGLQMEIKQAVDHRERWRAEAENHRISKEDLEGKHRELKSRNEDMQGQLSSFSTLQRSLADAKDDEEGLRGDLEASRLEINNAEIQIADLTSQQSKILTVLSELYKSIPPVENRQANSNSNDLNVLRAAFEVPKKPRSSYIAGMANTSSHSSEKFTIDNLAERIKMLLAEDNKLVQKLVAFSLEQDVHRGNADRANTMLTESKAGIQVYQKQIKDLENRIEVSMNQEVNMLERLNDLTESLEETRLSKRKLEVIISSSQSQFRAVEAEIVQLKSNLLASSNEVARLSARVDNTARLAQLENELSDVHDQLVDAQEELEDAKKREAKQRSQLLEELSELQQECSGLKTKLRQAERKGGK